MRSPAVVAMALGLALLTCVAAAEAAATTFDVTATSEALAIVTVTCSTCAWHAVGREAVVLTVFLDRRYLHHLPIVRTGRADYRVMLGRVEPGRHEVTVEEDSTLTAAALRGGGHAVVDAINVEQIREGAPAHTALSLAPIVYARPDTVGKFTDVPVFMWYEVEPTPRGTRYRYSVIFTNEDGGTPADRLMATWGRTTDIEYIYSVELDARGRRLDEDIQGPDHEILRFNGRREGAHPLLWVSTENNMVLPEGNTRVRYAPAPVAFPLRDVSREAVMDAHPWLYALMTNELEREGKIVANAPPRQGSIPDPRRFMFIEGCGQLADKALTFSIRVGDRWLSSDRGVNEYRIARDGCFRGAVPLPDGTTDRDVRALRVEVFAREGKANSAPARLTRINTAFFLDASFTPGPGLLRWQGTTLLQPGAAPFELPLR
jgi:hypothetical protein